MDTRRRLGLILPAGVDPWRRFTLERGFAGLAQMLAAAGFAPELLCFEPPMAAWPADCPVVRVPGAGLALLCGPGSAAASASIRHGHELWHRVRDEGYDALLAPLGGGILQPCLMSRSLGESLGDTAMLLWADTPTALRIDDAGSAEIAARAIDDALERGCLAMADAIFGPSEAVLAQCRALGARAQACTLARLPASPAPERAGGAEDAAPTLYHFGPGTRDNGADRFMDALERASGHGRLEQGRIVFAGPWRARGRGLSLELLGLRALHWPFRFSVVPCGPQDALRLPRPEIDGAAFFGAAADDDLFVEDLIGRGVAVTLGADHRLAQCYPELVDALPGDAPAIGRALPRVAELTPERIAEALARRRRPEEEPTFAAGNPVASICIVHRDRPQMLRHAIASGPQPGAGPYEVIVADTGSHDPAALAVLEELEGQGVRVLRCGPIGHRAACDAMAGAATGDALVFLDDDNAFQDRGCQRMVAALRSGRHDIVVTNLDLHDRLPPDGDGAAVARQLFLGQGYGAGLLFNCLGDSSFAIGRTAFLRLGGFAGYDGPANDWVFLARATAAGLSVGVLQQPAVRYRLDGAAAHDRWRKHDTDGARTEVLHALTDRFHFQFMLMASFIKKV